MNVPEKRGCDSNAACALDATFVPCKWRGIGRVMLLCVALSVPVGAVAANAAQALQAQQVGDFATAMHVWMSLAQGGDPVAEYNLGLLYRHGQGVAQSVAQARHWFTLAASHGLADAYAMLGQVPAALQASAQAPAMRSPNAPQVSANVPARQTSTGVAPGASVAQGAQRWIRQQSPSHYTLQLASSKNVSLIEKYISANNLEGRAGYYKSRRGGEDWYALVYGSYASLATAKAAIASLPASLRKWSPWVRKYADIQHIMAR